MNENNLIGLMEAYGFVVALRDPAQYKIRFQGHGTFIDIWLSPKKGVTLGVYKPQLHACYYKRNMSLDKIEDELLKVPRKD